MLQKLVGCSPLHRVPNEHLVQEPLQSWCYLLKLNCTFKITVTTRRKIHTAYQEPWPISQTTADKLKATISALDKNPMATQGKQTMINSHHWNLCPSSTITTTTMHKTLSTITRGQWMDKEVFLTSWPLDIHPFTAKTSGQHKWNVCKKNWQQNNTNDEIAATRHIALHHDGQRQNIDTELRKGK